MYWSHFEADWYMAVLGELGFDVLASGMLGHGYRDGAGRPDERQSAGAGPSRSRDQLPSQTFL